MRIPNLTLVLSAVQCHLLDPGTLLFRWPPRGDLTKAFRSSERPHGFPYGACTPAARTSLDVFFL